MSVLAYIELANGKVKKASFETASYAAAAAKVAGVDAIGVALGSADAGALEELGQYGLSTVYHVSNDQLNKFDSKVDAKVIAEVANAKGANTVVFAHNYSGKALAPRLSVKLNAGLVAGAVALPEAYGIQKTAFSNKGFAKINITSDKKIISVASNSFGVNKGEGSATVEAMDVALDAPSVTVKEVIKLSDKITLTEAELVVSAGRGLKGPENWGMIEEMADILGAATACSRAVSDVDWRPHHEHVGQTGLTVSPNLYIAVAISGAIQHLAGVSSSKTIVVINKDPEAPFFKAADYGIVGDAFEVVPKLNAALKEFKGV